MAVTPISGSFGNIGGINSESSTRSLNEAGDKSFEERLKAALENNDQKELKKACRQFEGIMLDIMFKSMRSTIIKSNLVEEDAGMEIFQGMLDDKLMEQASQVSSFGLADAMYKQLSRQIDTADKKDESVIDETGEVGK